jgi:hypothetical protein
MSRFENCGLCLGALMFAFVFPALMCAQDSMQNQSGMGNKLDKGHSMMTVTGCLKKGSEDGGYYITGQDGKTYELSSKSVDLSQHVNHTVTVAGYTGVGSNMDEQKKEQAEKSEAAGNQYSDLHVNKLKMVSASCTQ